MKLLISGINGTVAPVVAQLAREFGHEVVVWNRQVVPTDQPQQIEQFIKTTQPDWMLHIATGSPDWAEQIAAVCAQQSIGMLFTSSVSVFHYTRRGPIASDTPPDATDDYGRYKIECEQRIRAANPRAIITRLGWQIGEELGGNHMLNWLQHQTQHQEVIRVSTNWYPSCAFLRDSAQGILQLLQPESAGIYQLEGNPGLSMHQIAEQLKRKYQQHWAIEASGDPIQDNRMQDSRITIAPITSHW